MAFLSLNSPPPPSLSLSHTHTHISSLFLPLFIYVSFLFLIFIFLCLCKVLIDLRQAFWEEEIIYPTRTSPINSIYLVSEHGLCRQIIIPISTVTLRLGLTASVELPECSPGLGLPGFQIPAAK